MHATLRDQNTDIIVLPPDQKLRADGDDTLVGHGHEPMVTVGGGGDGGGSSRSEVGRLAGLHEGVPGLVPLLQDHGTPAQAVQGAGVVRLVGPALAVQVQSFLGVTQVEEAFGQEESGVGSIILVGAQAQGFQRRAWDPDRREQVALAAADDDVGADPGSGGAEFFSAVRRPPLSSSLVACLREAIIVML